MTADVRRVMLSLNIDANVAAAKAGMDDVARSAVDMADSADRSAGRLLAVADGADSVATNMATLAGAAGDIAGGLDSIGLGQFSDELESVAPPLMLIAGLADVTAVATNALSAANLRARATTIAKTVAEKASAAATKAMAAAQWAMNAAMSANPVGLIVLAIVALVAGLVLAYKKSETFRNIVNKVGEAGRKAIGWVVDKVGVLVGWVKDKAPAAFGKLKDLAVRYLLLITTPQRKVIEFVVQLVGWVRDKLPAAFSKAKDLAVRYLLLITTPQRKVIGFAIDLVGWVKDKLPGAFERAKEVAVDMLDKITAPIRSLIDFVDDLVDAIKNIDWPSPPDWLNDVGNILGRATVTGQAATAGLPGAGSAPVIINVNGAVDPERTARQISALLAGRARLVGRLPA